MNVDARCTEPASESNARGAQNAPRAAADYSAPVVASYDPESGKLRWGDRVPRDLSSPDSLAPRTLGGDSWKWLFLQPLTLSRE
jgi:phospholipid/cholesterol/gamma-HCH transport system substrate-binding protein